MLKTAGNQDTRIYIDRRQATVAQWVSLSPIFEVFLQQEKDYEGGGQRLPPWWRQTAVKDQLRVMLEEILEEARYCRQRES